MWPAWYKQRPRLSSQDALLLSALGSVLNLSKECCWAGSGASRSWEVLPVVKGCVWHWLAASFEPSPAEPSGPAGGGSSVRLTDAHTRVHTCVHTQGPAAGPSELTPQREMRQSSHFPALSWHHPGDSQMDSQPACSALLSRHHLGDGRTDGQTAHHASGQPDRLTATPPALHPPPPALPAAHRLPAGSTLWKIRARGCGAGAGGREGLRGRRDPPALGVPAPSWPPAPSAASLCLIAHYVPVRLLREINAVEFISTDGGQFSSSHLTDTSCTSLCQCPCAADNLYGEQVYYAVFILPAPLQIEFISPHLGEFRFSKEKGMKSGGRSRCAIMDSGASAGSVAAPGSAPTAPAQGAEHLRVPGSAAAAQGTTAAARAEKQWRGHPAPLRCTPGIFSV